MSVANATIVTGRPETRPLVGRFVLTRHAVARWQQPDQVHMLPSHDELVDVIIGVLRQVGNKHLAGSVWRSGVLSLRGRRARRLVHEPGA